MYRREFRGLSYETKVRGLKFSHNYAPGARFFVSPKCSSMIPLLSESSNCATHDLCLFLFPFFQGTEFFFADTNSFTQLSAVDEMFSPFFPSP